MAGDPGGREPGQIGEREARGLLERVAERRTEARSEHDPRAGHEVGPAAHDRPRPARPGRRPGPGAPGPLIARRPPRGTTSAARSPRSATGSTPLGEAHVAAREVAHDRQARGAREQGVRPVAHTSSVIAPGVAGDLEGDREPRRHVRRAPPRAGAPRRTMPRRRRRRTTRPPRCGRARAAPPTTRAPSRSRSSASSTVTAATAPSPSAPQIDRAAVADARRRAPSLRSRSVGTSGPSASTSRSSSARSPRTTSSASRGNSPIRLQRPEQREREVARAPLGAGTPPGCATAEIPSSAARAASRAPRGDRRACGTRGRPASSKPTASRPCPPSTTRHDHERVRPDVRRERRDPVHLDRHDEAVRKSRAEHVAGDGRAPHAAERDGRHAVGRAAAHRLAHRPS